MMDSGEYEDALQACIETWQNNPDKEDPNIAWLVLIMGRLYHRAGDIPNAAQFFELAATLANDNKEILRRVEMFRKLIHVVPTSRTDIENLCDPDLVLVQAPGWGINTPPLGTAMLSSYARMHGYKVLPLDLNLEFFLNRPDEFANSWELEQSLWFWTTNDCIKSVVQTFEEKIEAFVELILESKAKVVGFTIYDSSTKVSLEIAHQLKAKAPEVKIIFGGPLVSRFMAGLSIIKDDAIDAVAQGEGELILIDILERVKEGRTLDDCQGLIVQVDGKTVDNGDRELMKDLDSIPAPDFSDFTFESYRMPSRLPIMSSRGCANRCIFCNERPFWKKFRYRTAENVFAEIQYQMKRYPFINFLDFQDSLVNGVIRELDHLADLIINNELNISWAGQAVIRREMTVELMRKLKKSGCVCMAYGMETPSSSLMLKVGKVMSKGADLNAIAEAHGITGLGATYNVMFGLPGETEEDAFEAHEFLRRNYKNGIVVNPSPSFCGFSAGTLGYDNPDKYNISFEKGALYWESKDGQNTYLRRLKRFEDFCLLVNELGIQTTYPATHLLDRNRALGKYYFAMGDNSRAKYYLEQWLEEHPGDEDIKNLLDKILVKEAS